MVVKHGNDWYYLNTGLRVVFLFSDRDTGIVLNFQGS